MKTTKIILRIISYCGLLLTLLPSILVFADVISMERHKLLALVGTALWLGTAPFWMNKVKEKESATQEA